jgi:hypothetical protein
MFSDNLLFPIKTGRVGFCKRVTQENANEFCLLKWKRGKWGTFFFGVLHFSGSRYSAIS